jgi:hypothetical protein
MPIYIVWAPQAQEGQKVLINSDDDVWTFGKPIGGLYLNT